MTASTEVSVVVLTYNELDGACAAAMVLLSHPNATVIPTSAAYIGRSLEKLLEMAPLPAEIHICGVGISGDMPPVIETLLELRRGGSVVTWYSGKGYLKVLKKHLSPCCRLEFHDSEGSNTAAVRKAIDPLDSTQADQLEKLVAAGALPSKASPGMARLIRLVEAALARYFKYQDFESYPSVIPKLAGIVPLTEMDDEMIAHYQTFQYRHALDGRSRAMKSVCREIGKIAPFDSVNAIIYGETGVGKEHAANLIHEGSRRSGKRMYTLNCGTFSGEEALLNSRLFGHVKGAFTGANKERIGVFEMASNSTLFLDEIGELSLSAQARLLRVIQEGTLNRIGDDSRSIKVFTRVIAATHRNLLAMVRLGTFREDLFYRLNSARITLPPLRDRLEDIPCLSNALRPRLEEELGITIQELSEPQCEILQEYEWPGNVRQLSMLLKRVAVLTRGKMTDLEEAVEEERRMHDIVNRQSSASSGNRMDEDQLESGRVIIFL